MQTWQFLYFLFNKYINLKTGCFATRRFETWRFVNLTFCKPDVLKPDVLKPDILKPDVLWVYLSLYSSFVYSPILSVLLFYKLSFSLLYSLFSYSLYTPVLSILLFCLFFYSVYSPFLSILLFFFSYSSLSILQFSFSPIVLDPPSPIECLLFSHSFYFLFLYILSTLLFFLSHILSKKLFFFPPTLPFLQFCLFSYFLYFTILIIVPYSLFSCSSEGCMILEETHGDASYGNQWHDRHPKKKSTNKIFRDVHESRDNVSLTLIIDILYLVLNTYGIILTGVG